MRASVVSPGGWSGRCCLIARLLARLPEYWDAGLGIGPSAVAFPFLPLFSFLPFPPLFPVLLLVPALPFPDVRAGPVLPVPLLYLRPCPVVPGVLELVFRGAFLAPYDVVGPLSFAALLGAGASADLAAGHTMAKAPFGGSVVRCPSGPATTTNRSLMKPSVCRQSLISTVNGSSRNGWPRVSSA